MAAFLRSTTKAMSRCRCISTAPAAAESIGYKTVKIPKPRLRPRETGDVESESKITMSNEEAGRAAKEEFEKLKEECPELFEDDGEGKMYPYMCRRHRVYKRKLPRAATEEDEVCCVFQRYQGGWPLQLPITSDPELHN